MDSSGVGRPPRGREDLEKEFPEWERLWRAQGLYHAWRPDTVPQWKLRGRDWDHLYRRVEAFVAAYVKHTAEHGEEGAFFAARDAADAIE